MVFKTGITGLDEFLGGGLPPGVVLLIGPPGSGNTVFAQQIFHNRALEGGVTYCTVNGSPELIKDEMALYGWDVTPLEEKKLWKFIDLAKATSLKEAISKEMRSGWVIIDSLSDLLLTREEKEVFNLVSVISKHNKDCGGLHFILLTEGMHDPKVETALEHLADGVIRFQVVWGTDVSSRRMMIKKMRGMIVPNRSIMYSIRATGLLVETSMRIA